MHVFNVFNAKLILNPYRMMHAQNDFSHVKIMIGFYRNEVPPAYQNKQVIMNIHIRIKKRKTLFRNIETSKHLRKIKVLNYIRQLSQL